MTLDAIFEQAKANIPEASMRYEQLDQRRLVGLCQELQRVKGKDPFHLGCRTAGKLLDIPERVAQWWLRMLVADGILRIAATHKHYQGRFMATEYFYLPLDEDAEHGRLPA